MEIGKPRIVLIKTLTSVAKTPGTDWIEVGP